ncbi:thioesterase domain-containing protein [Simiduia curdlanivorans]|uniref:Thioesterase domain-containing protein n=1 Tax=Simiduia curdlanivorans TaxID=1492769 RepID=A0ABV8V687_9GAMM|nr:thioesterase domain-containing protein [Simiduia curdlanivorans]MDN3638731.1 thioesterase domain-containing protein [Simiduia curdlanivorans]
MDLVQDSQLLTDFFDHQLPITEFMGLGVERYDGSQLILHAPLGPNINDKSTAFGGSLYNAAVMACWGMIYLKTQEAGLVCNQVVAEGHIKYLAPVKGDIYASCNAPSEVDLAKFFERFNSKGRASITLSAVIECGGRRAVEFEGRYAILTVE